MIFFLIGSVHAGVLPDGTGIEEISNPTGGLNTTDPTFKISSKFSPYMRNVTIDDGGILGIKGFETLGSTNTLGGVTGIFPFNRETGQITFLVTDSSVTLETSDFIAFTFVSSGSNTGSLLKWLQVRNKMWGFNGLDAPIVWDGAVTSMLDGTKGTPNVPKFKYGQYYQDRVFGFNTTVGASDLVFSVIANTDAVVLDPTDSRAWPVTNNLKIGQGDGEVGTALWIKDGQLRCGKERSKYTIYGTNVSNYFARKDVSNSVGIVSDESVVNQDGHTYYLSQNGIYEDERRISDLIIPDIEAIDRGLSKTATSLWETQADFAKGNLYGTTATASGLVQPITRQYGTFGIDDNYTQPSGIFDSSDDPAPLDPSTTFYGFHQFEFDTDAFDSYARLIPAKIAWTNTYTGAACDLVFASITFRNQFTGVEMKAIASLNGTNGERIRAYFTTSSAVAPIFNGYELHRSSFAFKIEGCGVDLANMTQNGEIHFINATTAQYISDISTLATITAWGNFDSLNFPNSGDISFYYRTSTSIINITTQTWKSIAPGSIINDPTINTFIQYASTIASVSTFTSISSIDNVEITHIEGSSSRNRAFGTSWKNRYLLATTTNTTTNLKLIYMKARIANEYPDAWMPLEGINIGCFAQSNNIFYAGSSSTGTFYRLDHGTNFGGTAIPFIYHTPDMILGANYSSKSILKYLLDADKDSGLVLNVASSIDKGAFTNKAISFDGTGRKLYVVKGVTAPAKTLRISIYHSMLDKIFSINNLAVLFQPSDVIEPK